jgi:alpha-L-fucosidase
LTLDFDKPVSFNRFLVQEYIPLGQRVKSFTVEAFVDGVWQQIAKETTIGYKRILRFHTVKATKLRFTVTDAKSCPLISNIEIYDAPQILAAPSVIRNQSGEIQITAADFESEIFYTLDGTNPTIKSRKYVAPFKTSDGKVTIKCITHDSITNKNSSVTEERFDIARKLWKIIGIHDTAAYKILDGNAGTQWYQEDKMKMPC